MWARLLVTLTICAAVLFLTGRRRPATHTTGFDFDWGDPPNVENGFGGAALRWLTEPELIHRRMEALRWTGYSRAHRHVSIDVETAAELTTTLGDRRLQPVPLALMRKGDP